MDSKLENYIEDLKAVCRKHGLCFYASYDGYIVVTDFDGNTLRDLDEAVDERVEADQQREAELAEKRAKFLAENPDWSLQQENKSC